MRIAGLFLKFIFHRVWILRSFWFLKWHVSQIWKQLWIIFHLIFAPKVKHFDVKLVSFWLILKLKGVYYVFRARRVIVLLLVSLPAPARVSRFPAWCRTCCRGSLSACWGCWRRCARGCRGPQGALTSPPCCSSTTASLWAGCSLSSRTQTSQTSQELR